MPDIARDRIKRLKKENDKRKTRKGQTTTKNTFVLMKKNLYFVRNIFGNIYITVFHVASYWKWCNKTPTTI